MRKIDGNNKVFRLMGIMSSVGILSTVSKPHHPTNSSLLSLINKLLLCRLCHVIKWPLFGRKTKIEINTTHKHKLCMLWTMGKTFCLTAKISFFEECCQDTHPLLSFVIGNVQKSVQNYELWNARIFFLLERQRKKSFQAPRSCR